MSGFEVEVTGLEGLGEFRNLPQKIELRAVQALNKTAAGTRTMLARKVLQEVNLPNEYVSPGQKRLYVSQQARRGNLEARIKARARNVSLARFVVGSPKPGVAGVTLRVSPKRTTTMGRAFLMRLRQGADLTDTKFNLGLAIRLKPGETIPNKKRMVRAARGLYLLYGPSVAQVLRGESGKGVIADSVSEIETALAAEFARLADL